MPCFFFVKENKQAQKPIETSWCEKSKKISKKLVLYLIVVFLFSVGTSSKAFILLRAQSGGFDDTSILLLYLLLNVTASAFSIPFGKLSDKFGRKSMVVPAYLLYAATYFGFAFLSGAPAMIALFFFYGLYTAMITGAEKAMLVEMAPQGRKGTVLGLYGTMQGLGLLLSSVVAGVLWSFSGESSAFVFGGVLASVAAAAVLLLGIGKKSAADKISDVL